MRRTKAIALAAGGLVVLTVGCGGDSRGFLGEASFRLPTPGALRRADDACVGASRIQLRLSDRVAAVLKSHPGPATPYDALAPIYSRQLDSARQAGRAYRRLLDPAPSGSAVDRYLHLYDRGLLYQAEFVAAVRRHDDARVHGPHSNALRTEIADAGRAAGLTRCYPPTS